MWEVMQEHREQMGPNPEKLGRGGLPGGGDACFAGWEELASWKHLHSSAHLEITSLLTDTFASGVFLWVHG